MTTEVTRAEFDRLEENVSRNTAHLAELDCRYAVINTKLTAILWLLGAVGTAVIAVIVKMLFEVGL